MGGKAFNPNDRRLKQNRQTPQMRAAILAARTRSAQPEQSNELYLDADAKPGEEANITVTRFGKLPLYKLTPAGSCRIEANEQSIHEMLNQPYYSDVCFDCGRNDCLSWTTIPGEVSTNRCEGKPAKALRICPHPECGRPVYDTQPTGLFLQEGFASVGEDDGEDPAVIRDDMYSTSTPATRTASAMKMHIAFTHPQLAEELGYQKPPIAVPV